MIRLLIVSGAALLASSPVFAAGFDIRLGDDAAQFEYLFDSDSQIGIGGADIGAAFFYNENDDVALSLGALVTGSSAGRNRALQFGAGARAYGAELDCSDSPQPCGQRDSVSAVAVGGRLSYIFPSQTPMALTGELFLAPGITSFGDSDGMSDVQLRFEVEVAPATRFYLGYRVFEFELENTNIDYELDDSGHAGVRFSF